MKLVALFAILMGFYVGGAQAQVVNFPDPGLQSAVRSAIGKPSGVSNQEEYDHVAARNGSPEEYATAAMSPITAGAAPLPAGSMAALAALGCFLLALGMIRTR